MKDRTLVFFSLILSVVTLGYAAWIHQNAGRAAKEALRLRELELVTAYAPKMMEIHAGMTGSPMATPYHPQTIEELLQPLCEVISKFTVPELPDAPPPLQRIPDGVPR
jgi:hypothetical protein